MTDHRDYESIDPIAPTGDAIPMKTLRTIAMGLLLTLPAFTPVLADEIGDFLDEARAAYEAGDIKATKYAIDQASVALAQLAAAALAEVLPEALPGWTAEEAETSGNEAAAMAMLGGGMTASRSYSGDAGSVDISVMGDSPLLMMYAPMLANPMMAAALGRTQKIGSVDAIVSSEGQVIMIVANRFVVTVDGSADEDDKIAYAGAIDLEALATL
ncbi:hypothetical protein [Pelagibacterium montanilacus]|uniref:hypothetical protein n=1 Tax=Pelagibacterium montanilacus TaxID=2185280 RepID=UPI000F8DD389|nr:hypothetical protein [Pelagibacterium montanilacus]